MIPVAGVYRGKYALNEIHKLIDEYNGRIGNVIKARRRTPSRYRHRQEQ